MFKRILSVFSPAPSGANVEEDTSDDDSREDDYNHRSKRQRREGGYFSESSSEHSSPTSVIQLAGIQRQRDPRSFTTAHRSYSRSSKAQRRRSRHRNRRPPLAYSRSRYCLTDYEAEAEEDDESSTDEDSYRYDMDNSHRRQQQTPRDLSSFRHRRDEQRAERNWKKNHEHFYHRQKSQRERSHQLVNDRGIKSESNSDSPSEASEDNRSCARTRFETPNKIVALSQEVIGRKVEVKESVRLQMRCARVGTVTGWKDKNTVWVTSGNKVRTALRLTSLQFLPPPSEFPPDQQSDESDAKPRAKSQRQSKSKQSDRIKKTLETESIAAMPRSNLESQPDSLQTNTKRLQKTARKTSPVAPSTVTKKPPPKPRPKQKQQQMLSTPLLTNDPSKDTNSEEGTKWVHAKSLFYESDSDLDDILVLNNVDTGCAVFDVEAADPAAVEELRLKSLAVAATMTGGAVSPTAGFGPSDVESSTSENDDAWNSTVAATKVSCTSGHFTAGQRVRVRGDYSKSYKRGRLGTIIGQKKSFIFAVELDDGRTFGFHCSSLEALDGSTPKQSVEPRQHRSRSKISNTAKPRKQSAGKQSRPRKKGKDATVAPSAEALDWVAPQDIVAKQRFWGLINAKIILPHDEKDDHCFLKHILEDQRLTIEFPLKNQEVSGVRRELQGTFGHYEMVSAKMFEDKAEGFLFAKKSKYAKVVYAAVNDKFSIQDRLLRVADFTTLNPRKIAARFELFQSPTKLKITHHDDAMFQEIQDLGYVGGGFIHEDTLVNLLIMAGMGPAPASRAVAIQVRIFIPSMGIYKGMLVKKRTRNGAPIELPCSMQKVLPSTRPDRLKGAEILICKHKVHPTSGNEMIGKKLDPAAKDPSEQGFKTKIAKPLSPMVFRLWETLGVPTDLCQRYKAESLLPDRRNHAWLVGVPDPTGALPPDTIFVPGMKKQESHDLFVTRLPCYAREHGRKFRAITQKPRQMSSADWEWLNNLYFGVVIFSNPRLGMMSIPERIASGDLDGDLYLVCWDKEVVDSMIALPLEDEKAEDDGKLSTVASNPNWFRESQDINVQKLRSENHHLIGSLYRLAEKKTDQSEKKLDDPDSRALFEAYNEALEYQKHGRPIRVPNHLRKELKKELHHLVEWI
ncbi:unnamed protein product [Cylindrotheca closterium]|uniref:RNA-dependent RNA polymerase n=1 Tax=Cylindrotheca closterium TaxID=2856 RepID=A0AAD2PW17_9STRA|nr:unnamed protein product [Cylindrotheca closterium]